MRKMMHVTFECESCHEQKTSDYERQPVEEVVHPGCLRCKKPMTAKEVIPWTEKAAGDGFSVASFADAPDEKTEEA